MSVKLRRDSAGEYFTEDGRYWIERQDGETDCDHPLCEQLHQRFYNRGDLDGHVVNYVSWHVWDTERDDYPDANAGHFDTKSEAVAWLEWFLAREVQP